MHDDLISTHNDSKNFLTAVVRSLPKGILNDKGTQISTPHPLFLDQSILSVEHEQNYALSL